MKKEGEDKGGHKGNTGGHGEPENLSECRILRRHRSLRATAGQTWNNLAISRTEPPHWAGVPAASAKQEAPLGPWGERALEAPAPGDGGGKETLHSVQTRPVRWRHYPPWEQVVLATTGQPMKDDRIHILAKTRLSSSRFWHMVIKDTSSDELKLKRDFRRFI